MIGHFNSSPQYGESISLDLILYYSSSCDVYKMLVRREHWHNDVVLQNDSSQSDKYLGQLDHCFQTMSLVDIKLV